MKLWLWYTCGYKQCIKVIALFCSFLSSNWTQKIPLIWSPLTLCLCQMINDETFSAAMYFNYIHSVSSLNANIFHPGWRRFIQCIKYLPCQHAKQDHRQEQQNQVRGHGNEWIGPIRTKKTWQMRMRGGIWGKSYEWQLPWCKSAKLIQSYWKKPFENQHSLFHKTIQSFS